MDSRAPGGSWTPEQLRILQATRELEIATPHGDARPPTPIWVVVVDRDVYVRTWRRRPTGWYGRAVDGASASVLLSGHPVDVVVTVTGDADADAVDAAYRGKYGEAGAASMVTAEATASTLRLMPVA